MRPASAKAPVAGDWLSALLVDSWLLPLVPALIVWPTSLFVLHRSGRFSEMVLYWPMMVTMALGSIIAGSLPLGGGVLAFPVVVLYLGFSPSEGRDYTLLIQSIGMSSAAFLLLLRKRHNLHLPLVLLFVLFGVPGLLIGHSIDLPPYQTTVAYTTLVLEFAIAYFYSSVLMHRPPPPLPQDEYSPTPPQPLRLPRRTRRAAAVALLVASATLGGLLTARVGSGSDMVLYMYGLFGWNVLLPEDALPDYALTSCSVVVMGLMSVLALAVRTLLVQLDSPHGGYSPSVLLCWGSTAWLVVLGAPVGSMLLEPSCARRLRHAFFVLAAAQFGSFANLRIRGDVLAWVFVLVTTAALCAALATHHWLAGKARRSASPSGSSSLRTGRPTGSQALLQPEALL